MSWQMHYNQGADLLTYLVDPSVFAVSKGFVAAPSMPGLGIEINEALVRKVAQKTVAEGVAWRNAMFHGPDGSLREW